MLENKAILVRTVFRALGTNIKDRVQQREVEERNQAKHGKVKVTKNILSEWKALRERNKIKQNAYQDHINMTSPWYDEGTRILNSVKIFEYGNMITDARSKLDQNETVIKETYDEAIEHDKRILGNLSENIIYPSLDEVINSFKIESVFLPVPTSNDFRVEVPEDYKKVLENKVASTESLVRDDIKDQVKKSVEHLVEVLSNDKRIFDSLLENLNDLCERIEYLNVYDDPNIKSVGDSLLAVIQGKRTDMLRLSDLSKKTLETEVREFLEEYKDFFS